MSNNSKIRKSWEQECEEVHSPEGVQQLRKAIKYGLQKKYKGLAESMFRYDWGDDPAIQDMLVMSQDTVPEQFMLKNGICCWFEYAGNIYALPAVFNKGCNMYGKMSNWSPMPVGYNDAMKGTFSPEIERIRNLNLTAETSVLMKNDLFGGNDEEYIDAMINELVDNTLTMNQLQLIAKAPFVFNVTEDNLPNAKLFFWQMSHDKPAIFTNAYGDKPMPVLESTQMKIDPALFELFDRFECQILEYLGFPCVPITKRAQQTVSEVQSNDDKITLRRMEKLHQREMAIDRINKMFGKNYSVVSVIDEKIEEENQRMERIQENKASQFGNEGEDGE